MPHREKAAIIACLPVFAVFILTIAPGIFWRDSAEFVMLPFNLDIGHPGGSPSFTMLAGPFSRFPIGSIAFRSNLFSALMGAVAFLCFMLAAKAVVQKIAPETSHALAVAIGAAATVPLVFSTGFWYWAVAAEVYSGLLALVALIVMLAITARGKEKGVRLQLSLTIGFLLGLGCGMHMVMLLYAPAFGVYLYLTAKKDFSVANIAAFCTAFLLGFSVYALLPIRSLTDPPFDYGNPETWQAFTAQITGRKYSETLRSFPWHRIGENFHYIGLHLTKQLSPVHAIAAIGGVIVLAFKSWRTLMFFAMIVAGHLYLYIRDWRVDFGYGTIYLLAAFLAAAFCGYLAGLIKKPGTAKAAIWAMASAAVFFGGLQVWANYYYCDRSNNYLLQVQTRSLLDSLPSDALLVSYEDNINYASVYQQSVERWREDVVHMHGAYLAVPEYLHRKFPHLKVNSLQGGKYDYYRFLMDNADTHSPFWDFAWEGHAEVPLDRLMPFGRFMKVLDSPLADYDTAAQFSVSAWEKTMGMITSEPEFNISDWTAIEITARFWSVRAGFYLERRRPDLAVAALDRALSYKPDMKTYLSIPLRSIYSKIHAQMAAVKFQLGDADQAYAHVQSGLEIDPLSEQLWTIAGRIAQNLKDYDSAINAYTRSLKLNRAQYENAYYLASVHFKFGEYAKAEKYARDAMVYAKDPKWLYKINQRLAYSLLRQNKFAEAKSYLLKLAADNPGDENIKKLIALCDANSPNR